MARIRGALGVLLIACGLLPWGCKRPPKEVRPAPPTDRPIELLSWWAPLGASDPVATVAAVHRKRCPLDSVANMDNLFAGRARRKIKTLLQSGDPPDVFHSTVGRDHTQWMAAGPGDGPRARILALDDLIQDVAAWRKVIPEQLLTPLSDGGKLYGVPATVHRVNAIYYNKSVFKKHRVAIPRSPAELVTAGKKLRGAGVRMLALGAKEPWPLGLFVFQSLLIGREGPDFYRSYWTGQASPDDPRMLQTLNAALELFQYANEDFGQLTWPQAAARVAAGDAAATVNGDWASVVFAPDGLTPEHEIEERAFPGTEKVFVFTIDVFSIPVGAKNPDGAKRLVATLGSAEGQRALSKVKGCLSPRSDVNTPEVLQTPGQREKSELLKSGILVGDWPTMVPPDVCDAVNWALFESLRMKDIAPVVNALREHYRQLKPLAR